jgi:LmbE family N-acetylglucosaminyl deacetylase
MESRDIQTTKPSARLLQLLLRCCGVITRPDDEVTTTIDISGHLDTKIRALKAHSSQQDARWLAEIFEQFGEANGVAREFLYLAKPRKTTKETDIFE